MKAMNQRNFYTDNKRLLRGAVTAWIILLAGVVLFASVVTVLSANGISQERSLMLTFPVLGGLTGLVLFVAHKFDYRPAKLREMRAAFVSNLWVGLVIAIVLQWTQFSEAPLVADPTSLFLKLIPTIVVVVYFLWIYVNQQPEIVPVVSHVNEDDKDRN